MWFDPGYGCTHTSSSSLYLFLESLERSCCTDHVDDTRGIAKGNDPESIFAVMSGSRSISGHETGCCFDYGNSEGAAANNRSDGSGAMEAIYFGSTHWQGNSGDNSSMDGPWVGADLEAGMYYVRNKSDLVCASFAP